jgi:hypothetical protein
MNTLLRILAVATLVCGLARPLPAAVTISVDMDPATPGIQSNRVAAVGQSITVDLVMGVGAEGVSSYGLSVNFDKVELSLNGAPAATELLPTGFTYNLNSGANSESQPLGQIRTFEAATLGNGPTNTIFVIGSITLTAGLPVIDAAADVTLGFFNIGVDGLFDNAGSTVTPTLVSGYLTTLPMLTINYTGNAAMVSWPAAVTGWTLQTNATLATGTWGNYLGAVVNNRVTNSPPTGTLFFRLKQ